MRLRIAWTLLAALSLSTAEDRVRARSTTWADLAPLHARLATRGLTSETFTAYTERLRDVNAKRVRTGDLDHLVFYALQSTHFTALPAIEPALSAKAFVEDGGRIPPDVGPRLAALLKALDSSSRDPRLVYFRALVSASFPERATREAALRREYERVMRFLYDKEFVAQKAGPEAVAELYRARGLSTDTAVEAGYVVYNGLGVVKSLDPERRIRRVLIVGPGLDLAPRTSFVEAGPPQSYQPWAVIDALVSLGLARLDDLTVVGADINPRVVDRLRRSHDAPPALTLVSGIGDTPAMKLSPDYRDYFAQLGGAIGEVKDAAPPRGLEGHLAKTVRVRPAAAHGLEAETLDIVTERLNGPPFDLVIATNILPYFDDTQLLLAMSNIGGMLAPGGIFLHNEARPLLGDVTAALGFPFEQSRHVVLANPTGGSAAPLFDSVFIHTKVRPALSGAAPGHGGEVEGFSFTNVHDTPDLFRLDRATAVHWIGVKLVGRQSNRDAIGALVRVSTADGEQRQEVRGGGSYYSQNDFRLHFGLGQTAAVQKIVVRWPNGLEESWQAPGIDRLHTFIEGTASVVPDFSPASGIK